MSGGSFHALVSLCFRRSADFGVDYLTIVVLMQEGRSQNLSGAIAGGAETFLGKSKGRTIEAKLEKITKWLIVAFFVIVLAAFLIFLFVG